jgi:protein TonB
VILHILLALIFIFLNSGLNMLSTEYAEIDFVAPSRTRPSRASGTVKQAVRKKNPQVKRQIAKEPQPPRAEPVNLPKRRMLEEEEPQLTKRKTGKLSPKQDRSKVPTRDVDHDKRIGPGDQQERYTGERVGAEPSTTPLTGESEGPESAIGVSNQGQPFTIEGDAAKRSILTKVIPKYPPGLQKRAIVKISITVLPDGNIGQMIPVQKGDPALEEITIQALRKWRFNPLSANADQKTAKGIITFRYELE